MATERWRIVLWAGMLLAVVSLTWSARGALIPFAIGAVLAYALTPVVDGVVKFMPPWSERADILRRGLAVLLIYFVLGITMFAVGAAMVPIAVDQVVEFVDNLPQFADDARTQGTLWLTQYEDRVPVDVRERIDGYAEDAAAAGADAFAAMARRTIEFATGTLGLLLGFAIVPFWIFYALRDRHRVARNFMAAVPEGVRDDVENVLRVGDRLLLRYIRGQLLLGVVVGVAVGVMLTLMDVPLSLALGVIAGITELIPILGPWLGAIPGLIIVLGTNPDQILWVGLMYLGVQLVENNLLVPRIQGQALQIHPAMVLLLLIAGGSAFGFWGLVVIVPGAAILREFFWYADARLRGLSPDEAFARTHVARVDETAEALAPEPASDTETLNEDEAETAAVPPAGERPPETAATDATPAGDGEH